VHPDADFLDDINGKLKEVLAYYQKRLQFTPCINSIFQQFCCQSIHMIIVFPMLLISYDVQ
jgi:hypothetical protein